VGDDPDYDPVVGIILSGLRFIPGYRKTLGDEIAERYLRIFRDCSFGRESSPSAHQFGGLISPYASNAYDISMF